MIDAGDAAASNHTVPSVGEQSTDVAMAPADAGAPLTNTDGRLVPVARRGLWWLARQLAPNRDDGLTKRMAAEFRWKWFAGGDSEWRAGMVDVVNARLRRHLAAHVPGWNVTDMTSSDKVIGLHDQVSDALFGNGGDLSTLKARAEFHRTQDEEQCVYKCALAPSPPPAAPSPQPATPKTPPHARPSSSVSYKKLEMYTEDWMLDFILGQILQQLEAFDVDSLADKWFTAPVNEFIHPGTVSPPPFDYASDPDITGLHMDDDDDASSGDEA